jgi:hypothetical protein
VIEASEDDDVLAAETDDRRQLADAIVDGAGLAHRIVAEDVFVGDRDWSRHSCSFRL